MPMIHTWISVACHSHYIHCVVIESDHAKVKYSTDRLQIIVDTLHNVDYDAMRNKSSWGMTTLSLMLKAHLWNSREKCEFSH